jgi:hypothetical protein
LALGDLEKVIRFQLADITE